MRNGFRTVGVLIAVLFVVVASAPAFGASSNSTDTTDQFTSTNSAPTVTIDALTAGPWTPTSTDVVIDFTVSDANTVEGNTTTICFVHSSTTCAGSSNAWSVAKFGVSKSANATSAIAASGTVGTWGSPTLTVSHLSGTYDSTAIQYRATIRVGAIARASVSDVSNSWSVVVTASDGSASGSATSAAREVEEYASTFGGISARDFGSIAAGAKGSTVSQTMTGIKANNSWSVRMSVPSGTFMGATTATLGNDSSPGVNAFSIRCSNDANPDTAGGTFLSTSPQAILNSGGAAFTTDLASTQAVNCVLYNGNTQPGVYSGTVRTTLFAG